MNCALYLLAAATTTASKAAEAAPTRPPFFDWTDKRTQFIAAIIGVVLLVIAVKCIIEMIHRMGPAMPIMGTILFVGCGIFLVQMIYNSTEPEWMRPFANTLRVFLPNKKDVDKIKY
jgi:uncharacterized membrane protein YkgB